MKYLACFEEAVAYIEAHLGDWLTVEQVADHVGYSYYHLTRLFQSLLGENVGSYIQKRRLAVSCHKLLNSDQRIIDIALESGFESSEAYSRAFKKTYQLSPSHYRRNQVDVYISQKPELKRSVLTHLQENITIQPVIKEIPEVLVVGIEGRTNLDNNQMPELWAKLVRLIDKIPNPHFEKRSYGICQTSQQIHSFSKETVFTEFVGIQVSAHAILPPPLKATRIPAGKYAVFTHTGSLASFNRTYEYIWGTWFLHTNEQLANRVDFEVYDERFLGPEHPGTQIDICIPIL